MCNLSFFLSRKDKSVIFLLKMTEFFCIIVVRKSFKHRINTELLGQFGDFSKLR